MCFPSHLYFESNRIVNLNDGNPADFAVPTPCFAVGFIESRFDLVNRHAFTRIVGGNLMSPTIRRNGTSECIREFLHRSSQHSLSGTLRW